MTSLDRPLSGDTLLFDLAAEVDSARTAITGDVGRTARTLVKDGPLRVTLIVLVAGAVIPEHSAEGPITIQPISGTIRFRTADGEETVGTGMLLSAGAGVRHSVASDEGAAFLLTVMHPPRDG